MRSLKLAESLQQSLRDYLKLEQQNVLGETTHNVIEAKRRTRSLGAQSFDNLDDTTEFDAMMQTGVFQVPKDMLEAMNAGKQNAGKQKESKKINQVEELNTGDWINLKKGSDSQPIKLAWKAEDSSLFIFVDRDGTRVSEVDANQLAEMFESGEVSLMDSAIDSEKTQFSFMKTL